jgi:hypothetical protein
VHEHEVDVAVRTKLSAAESSDGDETDIGFVPEQLGEPVVDEGGVGPAERRARQAAVSQELLTAGDDSSLRGRRDPSRRCGSW